MTDEELTNLLFPHVMERLALLKSGQRLAHYTTAESGLKIIAGRQVWLRNALLMNDFSEIQHGIACLQNAWQSDQGKIFQEWMDRVKPGLTERVVSTFDGHVQGIQDATFVMSLSEHDDEEDELGRLSMWRAYGGKNGLALILNSRIFCSDTQEINVFSAPVIYKSVEQFSYFFAVWSRSIMDAEDEITKIDDGRFVDYIFLAFRIFLLCTKHPGFSEEREWRIFHSPLLDESSNWICIENEIIGGVPQEVVKLSLYDNTEVGVEGVEPDKLLNRVIIGPTQYPKPIFHSICSAMQGSNVENAVQRIWVSNIPLRQ